MKNRLAAYISNLLNPFLLSLIVVLLVAYEASDTVADAFKWSLLVVGLCILPVFVTAAYLVQAGKMDSIFSNDRYQRRKVYPVAISCAVLTIFIMWLLEAPSLLMAVLVASIVSGLIFMTINLAWKVSVHTAFITALVVILFVLYGWVALLAAITIPLMSWARVVLKQHSVAQTIAGALISATVVSFIYHSYGLF